MQMKRNSTTSQDCKSIYAKMVDDPKQNKLGIMMLCLIEYLEAENDAMDQWVYVQAKELVFTSIDTPLGGKRVYVGVKQDTSSVGANEYEITYFVEPPWWSVTGYTNDVSIAAQLIREAILRTVERGN